MILQPEGGLVPNSFIEYSATKRKISLRTGCVCNPGGAAAILGIEDKINNLWPESTLKDFEHFVGYELGVVRISLGLASNFADVWKVLQFATSIGVQAERERLLKEWESSDRHSH